MLDLILLAISIGLGGGPSAEAPGAATTALQAEPQEVLGKFTTATEIRPILNATKGNWVAVRDYNGQDLLYVTHLLAWRCGLLALRYGVNGGEMTDWPLPPCHTDSGAPNALTPEDGLPYVALPPGSVQSVRIELVYDDLGEDAAQFDRAQILMP